MIDKLAYLNSNDKFVGSLKSCLNTSSFCCRAADSSLGSDMVGSTFWAKECKHKKVQIITEKALIIMIFLREYMKVFLYVSPN
jgi:hypothetical protein